MKKTTQGFTLIELLVVIAIIGILSSIVIASLNSARIKGADAAVKGGMAQFKSQAELFYDTGNTYAGVASSTAVSAMISQIAAQSGGTVTVQGTATSTSIHTVLKGGGNWCVDNSGASKASTATAGVCA